MKKIVSLAIALLITVSLAACGGKKIKTTCECCGNEDMCYEVTWHAIKDKSKKESHWVCSKDCETFLTQIFTASGYVKE